MSKNLTVKIAQKGKPPRSLDYEPEIGDEIFSTVTGLQQVVRKVFDENANEVVIFLDPSSNPYP